MAQSVCWKTGLAGTIFYLDGTLIGKAVPAPGCKDHFISMGDGVVRWDRKTEKPVTRLVMRFEADYKMQYQMIPAVMYDENRNEEIIDYNKMRRIANDEMEESAENNYFKYCRDQKTGKPWVLAWWNMSIPGATYTEGVKLSSAMFLPPDQTDAAASVYTEREKSIHETIWPEQMMPRVASHPITDDFAALHEPAGRPGKIRSGKAPVWISGYEKEDTTPRCDFAVMLVFAPVITPRIAWHKMMEASWLLYKKIVPPKFSDRELWNFGIDYAMNCLYDENDKGFKAFSFGLMYIDGKWIPRPLYRYEMGWCGQSLNTANSVLVHALMTGDKKAEYMGFNTFDSWIARRLPNGMLPTHLEEQEYTDHGKRLIDACNLGSGAIQFFYAWKIAQMFGKNRPKYFETACDICNFALSKMNDDGRIGKNWTEDELEPLIKSGTTGAFLTMAICEGVRNTGRKDYLEGAKKNFRYYYNEFIRRGYTMGGAMDIFTIDKESAMPLLSAALLLYELTGDWHYIDYAENAAWYLSTWQWCYTARLSPECSLGKLGYNSFGGTSVSIHGPGNDPYALFYVHDLYDLSRLTKNSMWAERAHAAWINGADGISDGTMIADGRIIPIGGQHEARSLRGEAGSLYQWLVAWPTSFRLQNLRRIYAPFGDKIGMEL